MILSTGVVIKTFAHPVTEVPEPAITVCRKVPYNPDEYVRAIFDNFQMTCDLGFCEDTLLLRENFENHLDLNVDVVNLRNGHLIYSLEEWAEAAHANPNIVDKPTFRMVSYTKWLVAPFYFNYENPNYLIHEVKSGFAKMLAGVDGVYNAWKGKIGLVVDKFNWDSPNELVEYLQFMHSVLTEDLDAAGQKYNDLENALDSLTTTFWTSLGACLQTQLKVRTCP